MGEIFPELKEVQLILFFISEEFDLIKWLFERDWNVKRRDRLHFFHSLNREVKLYRDAKI